jgi:16S rRNA (adenine1518-N6/adenine1519-N6)-dimethyltransferase
MRQLPRTLSEVRQFVISRGFHPSRVLGQNFLVDGNILRILLLQAELTPDDRVLEVGPGLGVLTAALLEQAGAVTAIEKDDALHGYLSEYLGGDPRLTLIHGDALDQDLAALAGRSDKVVANLPYGAGSRILVELVRAPQPPERIVVTVQQEVAQRLTAPPGGRLSGLLTVWCRYRYDSVLAKVVVPGSFWPRPAVNSAIVTLLRRREPLPPPAEACFYAVTDYAFKHRRKQLATLLAHAPPPVAMPAEVCRAFLAARGLAVTARPEVLDGAHWRELGLLLATPTW